MVRGFRLFFLPRGGGKRRFLSVGRGGGGEVLQGSSFHNREGRKGKTQYFTLYKDGWKKERKTGGKQEHLLHDGSTPIPREKGRKNRPARRGGPTEPNEEKTANWSPPCRDDKKGGKQSPVLPLHRKTKERRTGGTFSPSY